MSAPALRPVARMRPVLLERMERQRAAHCLAALFLGIWIVYDRVDSGQVSYPTAIMCALVGSMILPIAQGVASGNQPIWDTALPADLPGYARVRLLCGLVGAAFLLAVGIGLYAVLFGIAGTPGPGGAPGYPGWFALVVFAGALACYLLASAVLLRTSNDFSGFLCLAVLFFLFVVSLRGPVLLLEPAEIERVGAPGVLTWTACLLGLTATAAYVATLAPARLTELARATRHRSAYRLPLAPSPLPVLEKPRRNRPLAAPRPDVRELPARHAPRPARRSGPHPAPAARAVFREHFALLKRFAPVPAVVGLGGALMVVVQGSVEGLTAHDFAESAGLRQWCWWLAIPWAICVWVSEWGARRKWNDTLPVGTAKRRMLHAGAGAAWLLLFLPVMVAAAIGGAAATGALASPGDLPAWLWLGLPIRTLTLYLGAALAVFGAYVAFHVACHAVPAVILRVLPARTPHRLVAVAMAVGFPAALYGIYRLGAYLFGLMERAEPRGDAAAALLLALIAASAAGSIVLNDWIRQRDRLPTVGEVRGLLRRGSGTRPVPPLRVRAGR